MAHWAITSRSEPRYRVVLADCDREHAESVYLQLQVEPTFPSDIRLDEIAAPDGAGQTRRSLFDRLLGR